MSGSDTSDLSATAKESGLIPRICTGLFDSIQAFDKALTDTTAAPSPSSANGEHSSSQTEAKEVLYDSEAIHSGAEVKCKVVASFYEIYNEKVIDLLAPRHAANPASPESVGLKVRENPKTGPYVDGAVLTEVKSWPEMAALLLSGNKQRQTAATNMNARSSRSHAVLQVSTPTRTTCTAALAHLVSYCVFASCVDDRGTVYSMMLMCPNNPHQLSPWPC